MNIEVDKLLWRKIDELDKYAIKNIEFYNGFQRIINHHRKSVAIFNKNLGDEIEMIDRLTSDLES